ncbi:MAG: 4Fe-4S binding protein [Promethearchaeota archaeon]
MMKAVKNARIAKKLEADFPNNPASHGALANSPVRSDIMTEMRKHQKKTLKRMLEFRKILPFFSSIMKNFRYSYESLSNNPANPKREVTSDFLDELEAMARDLGANSIGYARVPKNLIFKDLAILHNKAIVITMRMSKEKMNLAPSLQSEMEVFNTYDKLGILVNKLTDFLRENGYSAQANHPLGGLVVFPALAEIAGLGWHGRHGLLITPEYGPMVRIAAIYVNIENLPLTTTKENPHSWIQEFCNTCGACIKACPGNAIKETPVIGSNGIMTHVENDKCYPHFSREYGCSLCIKSCIFNKRDYNKIKNIFLSRKDKS